MFYDYCETAIGRLLLAADARGLRHIDFERGRYPTAIGADWVCAPSRLRDVSKQLEAYFAEHLTQFELPLAPQGTDFQRRVWAELMRIPYGETISYGELARRLGDRNASRAVGAANGRNPLPIVVPCHRVIGNDGSLTGFGGGLPVKRFLLELEQRVRVGAAEFALTP